MSLNYDMNKSIEYFKNKLNFELDSADLYEALETKENIVIIDARKPFAFEKEHIKGAINIPHRNMNEETTINFDRKALYVTYCDGIGCNASTKGALNMSLLGFKVKELIGGIEWWKFDGYPTHTGKNSKEKTPECAC